MKSHLSFLYTSSKPFKKLGFYGVTDKSLTLSIILYDFAEVLTLKVGV
jgi:hypothetical protein